MRPVVFPAKISSHRRTQDAVLFRSVFGQLQIRPCIPDNLESVVWAERRDDTKRIFGIKKGQTNLPNARIRTIGIAGCGRGVGTSHLAISMANYLMGVKRKKTAVLEWNDHGDFARIERFAGKSGNRQERQRYKMEQEENRRNVFSIMEVDYYKQADPSILSYCLGRDYRYLILDYGEAAQNSLNECARCDLKVLVGSLSEWRTEAFLEILEQTENRDKSWKLTVVSGGEENRKEIEKRFACRLYRIPTSVDAFRITHEKILCFETLLSER